MPFGQAGDHGPGHRLYLDTHLPGDPRRHLDPHTVVMKLETSLDARDRQRMAQRDQVRRALGTHCRGNSGDAQGVSLSPVSKGSFHHAGRDPPRIDRQVGG